MQVALVIMLLAGCVPEQPAPHPDQTEITLSVLPDQSPGTLRDVYEPLVSYLESATSLEIELRPATSYQDLLDSFTTGQVDLAWFGGGSFVRAESESGARPLVTRNTDRQFLSCYVAATSDTRQSIDQFHDARFAFGPPLSTSGHVMPRYFLSKSGRSPEERFGEVLYSSGHEQTARWVAEGKADLGVANCRIIQKMQTDGRLDASGVTIIGRTPPYFDYVWATSASMPETTRTALRDAFLGLDPTRPAHRDLLQAVGATCYYPAGSSDFDSVRQAVRLLEARE